MTTPNRELPLRELPPPPFFELADDDSVFAETQVGGEPARVGVLFSSGGLAAEFSAEASSFGMAAIAGLAPRELADWDSVAAFARSGPDHVLVVTENGTGLFLAPDVAALAADRAGGASGGLPLPLYVISDHKGESPLVSVETDGGVMLVAPLFTSPENARAFRRLAAHLDLPDQLGTISDQDGLRRHALVAHEAGAAYAVVDPEAGETEAMPLEELAT